MKVKIGISNRHVHLTKEDYKILFNKDELTLRNKLSQIGEFAANETVTLKTNKNQIENVRIIGPFRPYTQVELARTDAIRLGLNPPIRDSGELEDAEVITIAVGDKEITRKACILAERHIHITPEQKKKYRLKDKVKVKIGGEKGAILYNVHVKASDLYTYELHLDTDDANGNLANSGDYAEIIK